MGDALGEDGTGRDRWSSRSFVGFKCVTDTLESEVWNRQFLRVRH